MSPPEEGSSILVTSAPRSASWRVPHGPAPNCSTAITRRSASGCIIRFGSNEPPRDPCDDTALPTLVDRIHESEADERAAPLDEDDVVDPLARVLALVAQEEHDPRASAPGERPERP